MNIFHYRKTDYNDDPWQDLVITGKTDLTDLNSRTVASIYGQTVLRQHSLTYITGRDTCHAHHFAKMLAAAVLSGSYDRAKGLSVNLNNLKQRSVLWIDSVHRIYACADFFNEMITAFDPDHKRFSLLCLDKLGSFRYDFYGVIGAFEKAVKELQPQLIVIDDIDHLMPNCGINVALAFTHAIRDVLNHTEAACLFIGYNHLGKRASTTGNLGSMLFPEATNIFSVTTQHAISTVKLVKSFIAQSALDTQFHFTIDDNLPHEVIKTMDRPNNDSFMQHSTLRDIIGQVVEPGQTISPDDLFDKLNNRRQQLNRIDRTRALIAQAAQLGIIKKASDSSNHYTLAIDSPTPPNSLCRGSATAPSTAQSPQPVKAMQGTTFPPSAPPVEVLQGCALHPSSHPIPQPSGSNPEGCNSSTSHAPATTRVNNSLTLPPHPSIKENPSSITGCQPVKTTPSPSDPSQ